MDHIRPKYLEKIIECCPTAVAVVDYNLDFIEVSKSWMSLFDFKENIVGKNYFSVFPHLKDRSPLSITESFTGREECHTKADGESIWIQWQSHPWSDSTERNSGTIIFAHDVSDKRRLEEAYEEGERKFKVVFDQAAIGMALVTLDGQIISVNDQTCRILGYSREKLFRLHFQDFTHPDDLQKDLINMQKLLKGEIQSYSLEKRYLREDQSTIWAFLAVAMVKDRDERPLYFIATIYNINDRKLVEKELLKTHQKLEEKIQRRTAYLSLLLKISNEANQSTDVNKTLSMSLNEICNLTGWQMGHFRFINSLNENGPSEADLWCINDDRKFQNFIKVTQESRLEQLLVIQMVLKSKKTFWENDMFEDRSLKRSKAALEAGLRGCLALPILIGNETVAVMEFFTLDELNPTEDMINLLNQIGIQLGHLIERQRSQKKIAVSEARLQSIINNLPAKISLKDDKGRFLIVNDVFNDIMKIRGETIIGKTLFDFVPEELAQKWSEFDETVLKTGKIISYEFSHRMDTGNEAFFLTTKFPVMDKKGNIFGTGAITSDITEKKRTDKRMMELLDREQISRKKAEESIRARDEFISIASHDLKSPITAMKLKIQIILNKLLKNQKIDVQWLKKNIDKLGEESNRLVLLINSLLDITKIQAGTFKLNLEEVDLSNLIQNILENYAPQLEMAKCPLSTDIEPGTKGIWDQSRLEQVFVNLLTNAIKFGPGQPIAVKLRKEADVAVLQVEDFGRGISPQNIHKIFERYERGDVHEGVQGLGLGLFIVKQILGAHGGDISVESEVNKGSKFTVKLPLELKKLSPLEMRRPGSAPPQNPPLH